jgi:hypothetical protein
MKTKNDKQDKARRLLNHVTNYSTVYVIERGRTDTGRTMQVLVAPDAHKIEDITASVSVACKLPLRQLGVYVKGGGFSVAQHIADLIKLETGYDDISCELIESRQK